MSQRILLVEDDPEVREHALFVLEHAGFSVTPAGDGIAALREVTEKSGDFALVITDVVLPSLNGPELAVKLQAARPKLPILFLSGYAELYKGQFGDLEYVSKPFDRTTLLNAVDRLLAREQ
jgi:two-component system cell cycle sensor histidine kinase/response regulator CckA